MSLENWEYAPSVPVEDLEALQYHEYRDTGKESFSPGSSTANRTFLVTWEERASFLDDCLGYSYLSGSEIKRILPDPHPFIENFYAEDATVEGIGVLGRDEDLDAVAWTTAKINVNYKPRPYNVLADNEAITELERYTSKTFSVQADYLTLNGGMKFVGSGQVLNNPPGRITTAVEVSYTWHEVPALEDDPFVVPNLDKIVSCLGRVNSEDFDPSGLDAPPGTVLFVGVDNKLMTPRLAEDTFYWEITFKMLYRNNGDSDYFSGGELEKVGHNFIYDVQQGAWDLVTDDGTVDGHRIYEEADLNDLWELDV